MRPNDLAQHHLPHPQVAARLHLASGRSDIQCRLLPHRHNLAPPTIAGSWWQVRASGPFDHPLNLTLRDLLAMSALPQPITQSSAYYTGVRLRDVLQELGVQPAAKQLALQSADGFYESVEMQDMQDPRVLLVYGMNGTTLPVEHGYPLCIYIPNRYGIEQPKWIPSMEAFNHDEPATGSIGRWTRRCGRK